MDFLWDREDPDRFNPMDACTHKRVEISLLEVIDSLRQFLTGVTGSRQLSNEEFALILMVAVNSADGVD